MSKVEAIPMTNDGCVLVGVRSLLNLGFERSMSSEAVTPYDKPAHDLLLGCFRI